MSRTAAITNGKAETLGSAFARGSIWSLMGYGGTQLIRFGSNLVLWRLLFEEAFGMMAIVHVFLQALTMFSDIGIGPSIIQNKRGADADWLNTAWTLQIVRGLTLWAIACALAIPVARFYGQPELAHFIPVAAFTSVIAGFNSSKIFTEQRRVALGRITLIEIGSHGVGSAFTITWALFHPSVWALVAGGLVGASVRLLLSHRALDGTTNRLRWDPVAARALLTFGRWIFISTLFNFVAVQADRLIFGKLVSMATLGVYSIAQIWATVPAFIVSNLIQRVLFPVLSLRHNQGLPIGNSFRQIRIPVLFGSAWLISCLLVGGPTLIDFLYDERASDAGWMIQILSVGSWFLVLEAVNGGAMLASGRPVWLAGANVAKVLGMALMISVGYSQFGFAGAIWGFALAESLKYLVSIVSTTRYGCRAWDQDIWLTGGLLISSAGGVLVGEALVRIELPTFLRGLLILLLLSGWWGGLYAVHKRLIRARALAAESL